ncbi:MAG: hypothetical protein QOH65_2529 [Methylobacteriaceae bacterium]|nr:hypothetical protein [Methylobacteriaceae bacterium]
MTWVGAGATGALSGVAGAEWAGLNRAAMRGRKPAAAKATTHRKQASFSANDMERLRKLRA